MVETIPVNYLKKVSPVVFSVLFRRVAQLNRASLSKKDLEKSLNTLHILISNLQELADKLNFKQRVDVFSELMLTFSILNTSNVVFVDTKCNSRYIQCLVKFSSLVNLFPDTVQPVEEKLLSEINSQPVLFHYFLRLFKFVFQESDLDRFPLFSSFFK